MAQASRQAANRQQIASINQQIASTNDNGNYNSGNSVDSDANDPGSNDRSNGQSLQSPDVDPNGPASGSEEEEFECPNNGIFADVASGCQAYHVCQSGAQVQQRFQCPLGTLFNDIILTCDFAHNVQCNGQAKPMVQAWPDQSGASDEGSNALNHQQQQSVRAQQQLPTGWTQSRAQQSQQQQQQRQQQLLQANGPRQLMIGSQYSRPSGQQSVNRQTNAAVAYPLPQAPQVAGSGASQVSHLPQRNGGATGSGIANNNAADDSSDDSDDNEPPEILVPATLPPRRAPKVTIASQLPPLSPPPAPQQQQHHQPQQQQQYQSQDHRQTAHLSQYPQHQQQVNSNGYHRQASPAIIYGQSAGNSIAYGDVTSATTPVRAGTGQYSTEPTNAVSSTSAPGDSNKDAQSFNLVINHVTPTHSKQPQQQYSNARASGKPINNNGNNNNFIENPQKSYGTGNKQQQQVSPKATQPIVYVSGAGGGKQQQHNKPYLPSATAAAANQSPKAPQQPQTRTTYLSNGNNFAANRSPQQQQVSRKQPQQQYEYSSSSQSIPTTTVATTATRPNQPALVDLNNAKQAQGVSSDAINDGLLLIVRHSSGSNPLQLTTRPAHQTTYSNEQVLQAHNSINSPTGRRSARQQPPQQHNGQAYIVNPAIVDPSSQIDAQLFPNVQQFVADKQQQQQSHVAPRQPMMITAATRQTINSAQVAYDHLQQQVSSGPRTALASMTSTMVASPLPPMEPPRPQVSFIEPPGEPTAAADGVRSPPYGPATDELQKSYATVRTSVAATNSPDKPLVAPDANGSLPDGSGSRHSSDQQKVSKEALQSAKHQPEVAKTKRLKAVAAPPKSAKHSIAQLSKQVDESGKPISAIRNSHEGAGRPTSGQQDRLAAKQRQ